MNFARSLVTTAVVALCLSAFAQDKPESGAHGPSQSAADYLRDYTGADGAFLAAGLVKEFVQKDNLATLLQYKTDQVMILSLTGAQVKAAFERSLAFYPSANSSFLQISGFEVTFNKTAAVNSRVISVTAAGTKLEEAKTYRVAMPSSLGRGALGYFKVWDKTSITKTYDDVTIEDVLKGKRLTETSPRWIVQG